MPTKDEHVQKAVGNEAFADSIQPIDQTRIDWQLVILFYAAMHYVEAYLAAATGQHLRSHTTRDAYVSKESNLKKVRVSYAHLKYYGYNARYEVSGFTTADLKEAMEHLSDVKTVLVPLL